MGTTKCCEGPLPRLGPAAVQREEPGAGAEHTSVQNHFCLLVPLWLWIGNVTALASDSSSVKQNQHPTLAGGASDS